MDSQLIISVGREFGSAGHEIAEELSKHYGIDLLDHNLLDEIAMEKQVDPESLRHHDEKQKNKLFQNIFIHCLNKYPFPLGTSEGVKFVPSGDEVFFRYRVTFWPFPLVTGVGINFVSSGDEVNPYTSNHWERPKGTPVYKNNLDPVGPKFISVIFEFVHSHSLPLFAML